MHITPGKLLALLVAIGQLIAIAVSDMAVTQDVAKGALALLFPLALIWFPDELGSMTGYVGRGGRIDSESPPILISAIGWFLLLGIPALAYFWQ